MTPSRRVKLFIGSSLTCPTSLVNFSGVNLFKIPLTRLYRAWKKLKRIVKKVKNFTSNQIIFFVFFFLILSDVSGLLSLNNEYPSRLHWWIIFHHKHRFKNFAFTASATLTSVSVSSSVLWASSEMRAGFQAFSVSWSLISCWSETWTTVGFADFGLPCWLPRFGMACYIKKKKKKKWNQN